jgi:hypothetical protein
MEHDTSNLPSSVTVNTVTYKIGGSLSFEGTYNVVLESSYTDSGTTYYATSMITLKGVDSLAPTINS